VTKTFDRQAVISEIELKRRTDPIGAAYDASILLLQTIYSVNRASGTSLIARLGGIVNCLPPLGPDVHRLESLVSSDLLSAASRVHVHHQPAICGRESRSYLEAVLSRGQALVHTLTFHVNLRLRQASQVQAAAEVESLFEPISFSDEVFKSLDLTEFRKSVADLRLNDNELLNVDARLKSELDKVREAASKLNKKSVPADRRKGGRPRQWMELEALLDENPTIDDKNAAKVYNQKFGNKNGRPVKLVRKNKKRREAKG
jgi:hypothetical protein